MAIIRKTEAGQKGRAKTDKELVAENTANNLRRVRNFGQAEVEINSDNPDKQTLAVFGQQLGYSNPGSKAIETHTASGMDRMLESLADFLEVLALNGYRVQKMPEVSEESEEKTGT